MKRQLLIAQLAVLLEKRAAQDRLGRQPLSPGLLSAVSAQILGRLRRDNQDENRATIRMRMRRRGDDEGRA